MLQEVFYWIFNMSITAALTGILVMAANTYFPITYKVNILDGIFGVASVIWIIVSLTILLMLIIILYNNTRNQRFNPSEGKHLPFRESYVSCGVTCFGWYG